MQAMQIDGYGPPDVMRLTDVPTPEPGPGEIRIRIRAAAVNPADWKWRSGYLHDWSPMTFPAVLGYDIAGTVDKAGPNVEDFTPGERVFTMLDPMKKGGYAEYAVMPAKDVVRIPEGMDFATAAALPTGGMTGVQLAEEHAKVKPGQVVLVTGAVGGVGRFAVFAAAQAGARVVAAVRAGQADEARALGAADIVVLDEADWMGPDFDVVLDVLGGPAVAKLCRRLAPGGRIYFAGTTPIDPDGLSIPPEFVAVHPDPERMGRLAAAVAAGALTVPIATRLPLAQAAEAQRLIERGGTGGKVVLEV